MTELEEAQVEVDPRHRKGMGTVMTPDWDAINAGPTPSLDEYAALEKADPNAFWRLDCGHHQNLLDAALAEVERLRAQLSYDRDEWQKAEDIIARVRALCDEADVIARADEWINGGGGLTTTEVIAALDGEAPTERVSTDPLWTWVYDIAARVDGEWGCVHSAEQIKAGVDWRGDPLPDDCCGAEVVCDATEAIAAHDGSARWRTTGSSG